MCGSSTTVPYASRVSRWSDDRSKVRSRASNSASVSDATTLPEELDHPIGDLDHSLPHLQLYIGVRDEHGTDRAFVMTADSQAYELRQHTKKTLSESLVTNFLMKPGERFTPLARKTRLLEALGTPGSDGKSRGRIGVDFGSVSLCHVAAGMTEAVVEFAKGFAVWDLAPGHYILHASGGTILGLDGEPVPLDYHFDSFAEVTRAMDRRQRFVAAGSIDLAHEIVESLR